MSTQITTSFVNQYATNVLMLSQQKGSRLRNATRNEPVTGKNAFIERIGTVAAVKRTSRHADTPQLDTPHSRRRVSLVDYDWADLIDDLDKVRMLIDPASPYAQAGSWAMGRAMDDEIIAAFTGNAFAGVDGSTHRGAAKRPEGGGGIGRANRCQTVVGQGNPRQRRRR